ncbi:TetR/AcrR family transcriptional regulator [Martelella sp. HB161492]|uniref:TetR family transcriptional regulator n=1 Tax=Martelella sp. HB161492 TaxID=2720726 RepID=UPI001591E28B
MARPISEEKRKAILAAATRLIASEGTSVSTAKIARAAGVAEGTVFIYFASKDVLINALFLELEGELAAALNPPVSEAADGVDVVRAIWNALIDWGAANGEKWRTLKKLKISEQVSAASHDQGAQCFAASSGRLEAAIGSVARSDLTMDYITALIHGLAELTFEKIAAEPKQAGHFRTAGFDIFWNGITGPAVPAVPA